MALAAEEAGGRLMGGRKTAARRGPGRAANPVAAALGRMDVRAGPPPLPAAADSAAEEAIKRLGDLRERVAGVKASGGRRFNPGWHLALDLRNMLVVSECTARAALEREESRGGHTREDFPAMDPAWRKLNLVCSLTGDSVELMPKPVPTMRRELLELFEVSELKKYLAPDELADLSTKE